MLETGIKGKKEITVTQDKTAKAMGSGSLDVYATPAMIALMENTAFESVAPYLEPGSGTVGTALNVKHVSATPVGMKVTCETELIKVDGRALTFSVKAYDEAGLIGEGEHERFIIYEEKFQAKADAKLQL
jgi:predicted thioesterase